MQETLKILMLEDSAVDAEIVQRLLKKETRPFIFRLSGNKSSFLQELASFQPDLVLADNALPQFSAIEALQIVQQQLPHIPFILVTGTVSEEFAAGIIKKGADDYVLKDRLARLPAAIDAALRHRAIEKEKTDAAKRLGESEEKYRTLVEHAFDGIIIYTLDGTILDCNHSTCNYLGYTQEELKKLNVAALFFKEDLSQRPLYFESLKAGQATIDHRRLKRKDGTHIDMEIGTKMMPDGRLMAIGRDITERKKAAEQQALFASIVNSSDDAIISKTTTGLITSWNPGAASLFGYSAEEAIGRPISIIVPPERMEEENSILHKIKEGEYVQHLETQRTKKDGARVFVSLTVSPVKNSRGLITGSSKIARDITQRKEAEELLRKSYEEKKTLSVRMAAILNTLPANIALLDDKGFIVDVNDAWRQSGNNNGFIGSNQSIGENYIEISRTSPGESAKDGRLVANGIKDVIDNKRKEFVFEYPCHSPGVKRWFRMIATQLEGKELAGAVVMHIDISELRRLEEERLKSKVEEQKKITRAMLLGQENERSQLGQELHDNISQLLAAIRMKLSFHLAKSKAKPPILADCINNLQEAVAETRNLSHRMLMPRFKENSFIDTLKELAHNYSLQQRKVQLEAVGFPEENIAPVILETLYRIAQEQLNNIEKHSKASLVTVSIHADRHQANMIIKDNGIGFDRKKKRPGIGLTNISNRAESFNGAVKIVSEPGKGCSLLVNIPITEK